MLSEGLGGKEVLSSIPRRYGLSRRVVYAGSEAKSPWNY